MPVEYLSAEQEARYGRFAKKRGLTLHQLRHSRLTRLGEDSWSAPMLRGLSGHENLRSLGIYVNVNVNAEAVAAALAEQDPGGDAADQAQRARMYLVTASLTTGPP
jgi:hypothetical protein